ncbi:MAG: amidophosphoribosyltransferase [Clostridia bacterium]|nr:amidophosphoribosyltransferase [Clostridia bacterium]
MGGIFGVASKQNCTMDLFFGTDYHSHLGTRRGGMAVWNGSGFSRSIHNIENSPFRGKFEPDLEEMKGHLGIGCISDSEPQPIVMRSHLGSFAVVTVGRINNREELMQRVLANGNGHFLEMTGGKINATELVAALINQQSNLPDGIRYAQQVIDGSMTMLVLGDGGIYAARDLKGRTPLILGKKDDAYCASFESFAYLNLGYHDYKELGPGEIVFFDAEGVREIEPPRREMKVCAFLWTYYGYCTSTYEGVNVEEMRYRCGALLAEKDGKVDADYIAGVPDSGTAHAIGYANRSGIPFARPFIKYTPTWPRSFMPSQQNIRNLIARMKLIPVDQLIRNKSLLFIDDSIVRGTQIRETVDFLYTSGAKQVHVRPACPPIMFGCKYLNFSRSTSEMDLITRQTMQAMEGDRAVEKLAEYVDPTSQRHADMVCNICKQLRLTSLRYHELPDLIKAIGIDPDKICTYCWTGKE